MKVKHIVFHDKEYKMDSTATMVMDMKVAAIFVDSMDVSLSQVKEGDKGTAVSYAQALKDMKPRTGEAGDQLAKRIPSPTPLDELYLERKDTAKPEDKPQKQTPEQPLSAKQILLTLACILGAIILLLLLMPSMIYRYYTIRHRRATTDGPKAYFGYRAANFYLHQLGIFREGQTPMQYATRTVDPAMGTNYTAFMNVYLKKKYAKQELTEKDKTVVAGFLQPFIYKIKTVIPWKKRFAGFINPLRTISFFVQPGDDEINNSETTA